MTRTYEGMFLLDNEVVRAGWDSAKATVAGLLAKHGGKTLASRRWAERKLAYPIRRHKRGTYLLTYYEIAPEAISPLVRDLDINEVVLRYLLTRADEVPPQELELSEAEKAPDFAVPEPPSDDASDPGEVRASADDDDDTDSPDLDEDE